MCLSDASSWAGTTASEAVIGPRLAPLTAQHVASPGASCNSKKALPQHTLTLCVDTVITMAPYYLPAGRTLHKLEPLKHRQTFSNMWKIFSTSFTPSNMGQLPPLGICLCIMLRVPQVSNKWHSPTYCCKCNTIKQHTICIFIIFYKYIRVCWFLIKYLIYLLNIEW